MASKKTVVPERHGLFTIYPQWYEPSSCEVDIVAIHGLNGHAFKTWTDQDGHMWLRDSLPHHIPNSRIMTYGYDSALRHTKSKLHLNDFAQDLLSWLDRERQEPEEEKRPLVFICHSLGGVVVKQMLVMAAVAGDEFSNLSKSISAIAFFGTPHRGSKSASPARMLSRIFNAASFSRNVRSDLLDILQVDSKFLDTASVFSRKMLSNIYVVSFYEQQPHSVTGKLIVEPFSAVLGIPNERAIPINADHRGITRLSPRYPQLYFPVWTSIKELVEKSLLQSRQEYEDMMNQIFCVDYKTAQLRPRQPHPGTCDWIFNHQTYRQWFDSLHSEILVLAAPPGFGKTVLTRYVTEQVMAGQQTNWRANSACVAVSFFCSYNDQDSNSAHVVLRSLLHQLLQLHPRAQPVVHNTIAARERFGAIAYDIEMDKILKAIQDVLSMHGMENILISVDGIEELGLQEALYILQAFDNIRQHLIARHPSNRAKFLVSSRPKSEYRQRFPNLHILSIGRADAEGGIRHYVRGRINKYEQEEPAFAEAISHHGPEKIVEKITFRADGMFLWASLAWDNFTHGFMWNEETIQERLDELDSLPQGINPLYDKTLSRVEPTLRKDMWALFSILAVAKRPLVEHELCELLAVHKSKESGMLHPNNIQPVGGLVKHVEKNFSDLLELQNDNTILFAHLSFKEYLLDTWTNEKPELLERALENMAKMCLSYILHWGTFDKRILKRGCLAGYANRFYLHHLAALRPSHWLWDAFSKATDSLYFEGTYKSPVTSLLLDSFGFELLLPFEKVRALLRQFVANGYKIDNSETPSKKGAILNHCFIYGSEGTDVVRKNNYRRTIELLLELGANPNIYPPSGRPNLKEALLHEGGGPLQDILLNHPKFDLNRMDHHGQTALHMLMELGTDERICAVLDMDADVNTQDNSGNTPLHIAVALARDQIVRKLLFMPETRTDLVDNSGRTPLALATWWGLKQTALIFIERPQGTQSLEGGAMALMNAARHGQEDVVALLLPAMMHEDVNSVIDDSGKRLIHHVAMNDWSKQLEQCLKLSHDINIDDIDDSGKTALHYAAKLGCTESCKVLLLFGARTNIQDRNGMNAVQLAADAGFKDTLMALIITGRFDANQRDHQGRNLVHWCATIDCLDVMDLICQHPGVELARRDNSNKMPVDYAWACQCQQVGRYLSSKMRLLELADPWVDPYNWSRVYQVAANKVATTKRTHGLFRQVKDREEEERRREELRYPMEKWALAIINDTN